MKQQLTALSTELEVTKASHTSTAASASTAAAQVASLSQRLGEAQEALVKKDNELSVATTASRELEAKLKQLDSESKVRVEQLTTRLQKSESQCAEEVRQKTDLASKLSVSEAQVCRVIVTWW